MKVLELKIIVGHYNSHISFHHTQTKIIFFTDVFMARFQFFISKV